MAISIGRREFMAALVEAATAWPLSARAQQQAMPVIGFLSSTSADPVAYLIAAFRQGLSEAGYVEGRNVAIEYRWAEGQYDRLPAMVSELLRRDVAVIAALGTPSALAAKTATTMIPIVFVVSEDPVKLGLVASVARPGGNATGVSYLLSELGAKQLGLLRELVPAASRFGLLVNPNNENAEAITGDLKAAAATSADSRRGSAIPLLLRFGM
jgi:putative ABC transport system substrate-binding protein